MKHTAQQSQSGQVGVIILMMTAVILTIAISLSQRTLQEQDIAFIQDESTRVFNAAESGLEEALYEISQNRTDSGDFDFNDLIGVDYDIDSDDAFNMNLSSGQAVTIPFKDDFPNTNLTVGWWDKQDDCGTDNSPAAVMISIFTNNNVRHFGYDPCSGSGSNDRHNNFESTSRLTTDGTDYFYEVEETVTSDDIFVRVRPLYNNSKLNISSNAIDVAQYNILSTAASDDEDIARTLSVQRSQDGPPHFMDFALVSGNDLVKN